MAARAWNEFKWSGSPWKMCIRDRDIVAKHIEDHIGMLDEISYREQLWGHKPLSDFWRIGSRTERKLAGYGIQTMGDIALASIPVSYTHLDVYKRQDLYLICRRIYRYCNRLT